MLRFLYVGLFLVCSLGAGCRGNNQSSGDSESDEVDTYELRITIQVPDTTSTVYLTGNLPQFGPWQPDGLALDGEGAERTATIQVPEDHMFEYKFTLGSWNQEALSEEETVLPNFQLNVNGDMQVQHEINQFKRDPIFYMDEWKEAGISGTMINWTNVSSAFLSEMRHVQIWLPSEYDQNPDQQFGVLYMHDGQNLFDSRLAGMGVDWGVDEAVVSGVSKGLFDPVIVVGAWNSSRRTEEYSPWHEASEYARFLIEELMPRVNAEFRTLTGPENTFVMGSSMGGLLSYYLVKEHPESFGACGCVSTHFPLSEAWVSSLAGDATASDRTPYILKDIEAGETVPEGARFFFDYGTKGLDADYGPTHEAVRDWLLSMDRIEGEDFLIREYEGADHNEASWRANLENQLVWMLAGTVPTN